MRSIRILHYHHHNHNQVVLLKCRIRHSKITHSYLLTDDDAPYSVLELSLLGFLECHDLAKIRNGCYKVISLIDFLSQGPSSTIINYLISTGL